MGTGRLQEREESKTEGEKWKEYTGFCPMNPLEDQTQISSFLFFRKKVKHVFQGTA